MSQARRTRHFAFRASRKMPRSPRLDHKAPVMQAIFWLGTKAKQLQEPREEGGCAPPTPFSGWLESIQFMLLTLTQFSLPGSLLTTIA